MKKYKVGKRIKSLNQLMKQELIYVKYGYYFRILHWGWFQNYQFRLIVNYLKCGKLYKAIPTKEYKKELKARKKVVDRLIEIPNELPF
jgi:hypothetical protein